MEKQTPLYGTNLSLHAKMVHFAGWEMPVYFSSIKQEHFAVRKSAGLFDIGHMGLIKVSGKTAQSFVQKVLTNDAAKLNIGDSQYSMICNSNGGVIDDIFIYRINDFFVLVVNASNTEKDVMWLQKQVLPGTEMKDMKDNTTLIAFQGPMAQPILQKLTRLDLNTIGHHKIRFGKIKHVESLISRTGYTGEDGFELFVDKKDVEFIWALLLEAGKKDGVLPCGLGARDTLRLEAGMPLYGHEYDEATSPLEAGFSFAVNFDKGDFIGRPALVAQKQDGVKKRLVGLKMLEKMIPRQGYQIYLNNDNVGMATSGTLSPTLDVPIAMAYVKTVCARVGLKVDVEIRGVKYPAEIVKLPFYKRL